MKRLVFDGLSRRFAGLVSKVQSFDKYNGSVSGTGACMYVCGGDHD